jgi:hypothetical protein
MTQNTPSMSNLLVVHNTLVIPMSDGYAVSCSCGWEGEHHKTAGPAELEAESHQGALKSVDLPPLAGGSVFVSIACGLSRVIKSTKILISTGSKR